MCVDEFTTTMNGWNKVAFSYDSRNDISYFLMKIEPKMTMALICAGKRSEKDANIKSFAVEIATNLRMSKMYASIRPGYK